jgi:hypothetical protein
MLNRKIDIGDQIPVTFVLHAAWMQRFEDFGADLRYLPSHFE